MQIKVGWLSSYVHAGTRDIEPAEVVEAVSERPTHVGTFSNVVVVGNRIDIQVVLGNLSNLIIILCTYPNDTVSKPKMVLMFLGTST